MADDLEAQLKALNQKVEKESRFTRSLIVVCTAAMLGVSLVPVKIMLSDLPNLLITEFITKLELVHMHWKVLDKLPNGGSGGAGGTIDTGTP